MISSILRKITSPKTDTDGSPPTPSPSVAPAEAFFFIQIVEENEMGATVSDLTDGDQTIFEAGKTYKVLAGTDPNRRKSGGRLKVGTSYDISLDFEFGNDSIAERIRFNCERNDPICPDNTKDFEIEFEIETDEALPSGELTLFLTYMKTGSGMKRKPVRFFQTRIALKGSCNPPDRDLFPKCNVSIDSERPDGVALMRVEKWSDDRFFLTAWGYRADRHIYTKTFGPLHFDLPKLMSDAVADLKKEIDDGSVAHATAESKAEKLREIRARLRDYSDRNFGDMLLFLKSIADKCGPNQGLVVIDDAGLEIPWEMIEMGDNLFLGTVFAVARWLPSSESPYSTRPSSSSTRYSGRFVAYIHESNCSEGEENEKLWIEKFHGSVFNKMNAFGNRLRMPLDGIGLLYLGCHGFIDEKRKRKECVLETKAGSGDKLTWVDIESLDSLDGVRPLAFANACHSGRIFLSETGLSGLPYWFLRRISDGFIGAVGDVETKAASRFAGFFFEAVAALPEGASPAETLRDFRINAAKAIKSNEKSLEKQLEFLAAFMYVYYGHPFARISLLPKEDDDEKERDR